MEDDTAADRIADEVDAGSADEGDDAAPEEDTIEDEGAEVDEDDEVTSVAIDRACRRQGEQSRVGSRGKVTHNPDHTQIACVQTHLASLRGQVSVGDVHTHLHGGGRHAQQSSHQRCDEPGAQCRIRIGRRHAETRQCTSHVVGKLTVGGHQWKREHKRGYRRNDCNVVRYSGDHFQSKVCSL